MNRIDVIGQNGNEGLHYDALVVQAIEELEGIIQGIVDEYTDEYIMDRLHVLLDMLKEIR